MISRIMGPLFMIYWGILYLPITTLASLSVIILSPITPQKYGHKLRVIPKIWGWFGIKLALSPVKVLDKDKATKQPCVIISNHQSPFDIFVAVGFYPVDFLFLSKKEVFKIPLVGAAMKKVGYLEVDRTNPKAAARSIANVVTEIKKNQRVLIYPEGTRSKDARKILPFKSGALRAAKQGGLPILPIVVYGTQEIRSMVRPFHLWPHKIVLKVLDPISIESPLHPANKSSSLSEQEKAEKLRMLVQENYLNIRKQYHKAV